MQVILLEKIANLGDLGALVKVKPGYARNYLIPYGKAAAATGENIAEFEQRRVELERAAADSLAAAEHRREGLDGKRIEIAARASEEGTLFGSVGVVDIANAITESGVELNKSEVRLPDGPLKSVGEHSVSISLHSEVECQILVAVVPE